MNDMLNNEISAGGAAATGNGGTGNDVTSADAMSAGVTDNNGAGTGGAGHSNAVNLRDKVEEVLHTVHDPEIPVNIFDLGLVYEVKIEEGGKVKVTMTLTAPACPVAGEILNEVQTKVEAIEGVSDCHVNLTFDPPWTKDMMSEEAKLELGFL